MKSGPQLPKVVQVSVTDRCQCSCAHCGVSFLRGGGRKPDPSFGDIKKIFLDLKAFGGCSVDLFGGEPTLRKDLCEIVALGSSYGLGMLLETNGALLDRPYLQGLKKAGLGMIYLSLDDYSEAAHDEIRGRKGVFKAAVRALNLCRELGLTAHVSMVPREKEYFTDGRMNKFIRFCMANGAVKVRILFPSRVGSWSLNSCGHLSEKEEREVFGSVKPRYRRHIYVEDMESNPSLSAKTKCPAKSLFCHITTAGLVLPCPYLPLVFGDIKKESLLSIFSRIQGHPCMKENGCYCPSRDEGFLARRLAGVSESRPYLVMESDNAVRVSGGCNNGCRGCAERTAAVPRAAILKRLAAIDRRYSAVDIYGGDPLVRKDIFDLLAAVPSCFGINFHSNARAFSYPELVEKLKKSRIHCVKVPMFSLDKARYEAFTRVKGSFAQAAAGVRNLCRAGIPVSVYIPEGEVPKDLQPLLDLGVSSVSVYSPAVRGALPDTVLCFGKKVGKVSLVKLRGSGQGGGAK